MTESFKRTIPSNMFFTNDWLSAVKQRGIPLDNARVLSHAEDSGNLWRIWNICREIIAHVIRPDSMFLLNGVEMKLEIDNKK